MVTLLTAFVSLNGTLVSLLSVVCVVTDVLMRSVASLALVLSIFNVPTVPGATSVPSGLIAFHSVLFAPMLQSDFMAFPYGIIWISPSTQRRPDTHSQQLPQRSAIPAGLPSWFQVTGPEPVAVLPPPCEPSIYVLIPFS